MTPAQVAHIMALVDALSLASYHTGTLVGVGNRPDKVEAALKSSAYTRAAVEAALRDAPQAEGWVMVPVEPTPEMIEAAASFGGQGGYSAQRGDECAQGYRDMLAARPSAPTAVEPVVKDSLTTAAAVEPRGELHDFTTHRASWRKAIEHLAQKDDSGYWPHELKAYDNAMAAFDLAALRSMPAEPVAWPDDLSSKQRSQAVRFGVCDNLAIDDDDFRFDALIVVSGDFGEGEKEKYVAEVCRRLNGATQHTEAVRMSEAECRTDGRCQYAIDHGAEDLGHCPKGKCVMPALNDAEERVAFEAWVNEQPEGVSKKWWCRRIDDGGYSCYEADLTWRAWKARAVEQATAARLGVKMGDV